MASRVGHAVESPFQDYESMTGFEANAWIRSTALTDINVDFPQNEGDISIESKLSLYETIKASALTSKFAELVDEYPDIAFLLRDTSASLTLFAPVNKAFDDISYHLSHTRRELLETVLKLHISSYCALASYIAISPTHPILGTHALNGDLRLRFSRDTKGLLINYYSHVVSFNIFASNGVTHFVDKLLLPPPPALKIIGLLPAEFSTLQLGLLQTNLLKEIEGSTYSGLTLFAPNNRAFQKLGPAANAFLFSEVGKTYLHALLKYHIVFNKTLYSNAFYHSPRILPPLHSDHKEIVLTGKNRPKGSRNFVLPSLLDGREVAVMITRDGPDISLLVNGSTTVTVPDGMAEDGVVHVVDEVLFPPKSPVEKISTDNQGPGLGLKELRDLLKEFVKRDEA